MENNETLSLDVYFSKSGIKNIEIAAKFCDKNKLMLDSLMRFNIKMISVNVL